MAGSFQPLIGRAAEIERTRGLLIDEQVRLLTLVGPGGVGKTRLALALADALRDVFADGTCFVDLAPLQDSGLVLSAIAHGLLVSDSSPQGLAAALQAAVGNRHLLLILDNFEQVIDAAPVLGDLLGACTELRVLVTSREPLALAWEQLFEVASLGYPAERAVDTDEIACAPAVALFVQQARLIRPHFALGPDNARGVAEICRRLDGLPLAIELAAARTRLLSPDAILLQLRQRPMELLSGGARDAPARHRTLREAIAWSFGLLEVDQQRLFRRLSVFVGGCTLDGIRAVNSHAHVIEGIESLVDKHLLIIDEAADTEPRYTQLETIREFGVMQLAAAGEADEVRARHAGYLVGLVETLAPQLYGAAQRRASQQLLAEHNNVRAALEWSLLDADEQRVELGLRLGGALWLFWRLRGFVGEGRRRLAAVLERAGVQISAHEVDLRDAPASVALARALYAAGYLAFAQAAGDDAQALLSAALNVAREVGDRWVESYALHGLGHAAMLRGEFGAARALYGQRLVIAHEQDDQYALGQVLNSLGEVARSLDEPGVAHQYYAQSLQIRRELGDTRGVAMGLTNLGHVLVAERELARARTTLAESLALLVELGHEYGEAVCASALAAVAAADGQPVAAARLLGATSAALERVGNSLEPADQLAYDQTMVVTRKALQAGFEVEFAAGRELSVMQAAASSPGSAETQPEPSVVESKAGEPGALSAREREVVTLIARGCTSETIADVLVIARRTADTHAAHIREKLGLRSRAEIAAWAIRNGLG
jgi:predicted ATPase/DNA-binding CsgD family transcriptional regulator